MSLYSCKLCLFAIQTVERENILNFGYNVRPNRLIGSVQGFVRFSKTVVLTEIMDIQYNNYKGQTCLLVYL